MRSLPLWLAGDLKVRVDWTSSKDLEVIVYGEDFF